MNTENNEPPSADVHDERENLNKIYHLQSISPSYNVNQLYDSRNLVNSNSLDNLKY